MSQLFFQSFGPCYSAGLLTMLAVPATSQSTPVAVKIYDQKSYNGSLHFMVGHKPGEKVILTGSNRVVDIPTFEWPASASLGITGEFAARPSWWKGPKKGSVEWKIVDLAPLLGPLRDGSQPMDHRVLAFFKAKALLEAQHQELLDASLPIEIGDKSSRDEIAEAEHRLGFSLPKEYMDLLAEVGQLTVDDSFLMPAKALRNAFEQMEHEWETPRETLDALPKQILQLLRASVILFTAVGDGYSALLYQPDGSWAESPGPTYFWMTQDAIVSPELLRRGSGEMRSFPEALIHVIARIGLSLYESGAPDVVFRDSSATGKAHYQLEPDQYSGDFSFRLRINWETFE